MKSAERCRDKPWNHGRTNVHRECSKSGVLTRLQESPFFTIRAQRQNTAKQGRDVCKNVRSDHEHRKSWSECPHAGGAESEVFFRAFLEHFFRWFSDSEDSKSIRFNPNGWPIQN